MPVRQPPPTFRKLPDPIFLGDRAFRAPDASVLSPTSPLERNLQSPKGWKNHNSDGIGLGILAALEKSGSNSVAPAKLIRALAPITIVSPTTGRGGSCIGMGPKICRGMTRKEMVFFCGSPPTVNEETAVFRGAGFLSHCYLCGKKLHGRDIYMYRGEKAFCSTECRYSQIVSDEFQEKCGIEASKSSTDISSSLYSGDGWMFLTEIIAA